MSSQTLNARLIQNLPLDVAREILETSARLDRATALKVVLLSKTIGQWINSILYRTVVLNNNCSSSLSKFAETIRWRNDAAFFHRHVKVLYVNHVDDAHPEDFSLILSTCTGVISLAVFAWRRTVSLPLFPSTNPKYMSLNCFGCSSLCTLPSSLTHLELRIYTPLLSSTWSDLSTRCPLLDTLIIDNVARLHLDTITEMLLPVLSLSVRRIILRSNAYVLADLSCLRELDDPRFVIVPWDSGMDEGNVRLAEAYPKMVYLLPRESNGCSDRHKIEDWTCPTEACHPLRLWERVESWKEETR